MSTEITIGSCKSYEEFQEMMYNWRATADRIYEVIQTLPDDDNKYIVGIIEWDFRQTSDNHPEFIIHAKCIWQSTDSCMAVTWEFPAKYLFMSDAEILNDWLRGKEDEAAQQIEEEKRKQREQEQAQYQEYLRLKELYEGKEAVNGLPEKSPNL